MTAPTGATSTANGAGRAGDLAEAHARLMADRDLQFRMTEFEPPRPPGWLEPLLEFLRALGPLWQAIFWLGLTAIVGTILWLIGRELVRIGRSARPEARNLGPETWRPDQAAARVLLSDADALAAQGRFAEAVHLILLRSIDELKARRPKAIRPALIGGRPVDADDFAACRRDYEAFALPGTWAG